MLDVSENSSTCSGSPDSHGHACFAACSVSSTIARLCMCTYMILGGIIWYEDVGQCLCSPQARIASWAFEDLVGLSCRCSTFHSSRQLHVQFACCIQRLEGQDALLSKVGARSACKLALHCKCRSTLASWIASARLP